MDPYKLIRLQDILTLSYHNVGPYKLIRLQGIPTLSYHNVGPYKLIRVQGILTLSYHNVGPYMLIRVQGILTLSYHNNNLNNYIQQSYFNNNSIYKNKPNFDSIPDYNKKIKFYWKFYSAILKTENNFT